MSRVLSMGKAQEEFVELWYRSLLVFLILLAVAFLSFFLFFFPQSTHSQDSIQYISVLHTTDVALPSLP